MAKKEVYECEQCKEVKNRTFVFEGMLTKVVLNAPVFMPTSIRTEVCSIDCLMKKIRKLLSRSFEEKPFVKEVARNNKAEAQK